MEAIRFTNTERVLREYGERVAAAYREKMRGNRHTTLSPDTLINNVEVEVDTPTAGRISVSLRLADYWKFVEWDTRPHFPPVEALRKWVEVKPVLPQPDSRGRIPTPDQIAFAIGRKIAREGTTGTHDLADAVQEMNAHYLPAIREAVAQDIGSDVQAQIWLAFGQNSR